MPLFCVCACVLSPDLTSIIQVFFLKKKKKEGKKKKKKNKDKKRKTSSALCFVACLCPLARTVWNRFYWKSLLKFQHWGEYWSLVHNGYQTAESSKEGSKQADIMSVTIHFFNQPGYWFNILKKALNARPFIASVRPAAGHSSGWQAWPSLAWLHAAGEAWHSCGTRLPAPCTPHALTSCPNFPGRF